MSLLGRTDYFEVLQSSLGNSVDDFPAPATLAQIGCKQLSHLKRYNKQSSTISPKLLLDDSLLYCVS
jgi:hypothetical protein